MNGGNSVTAADMADVWIHEGFATYAELMFWRTGWGKMHIILNLLKTAASFSTFGPWYKTVM
jgi:aminopeptidase N